MHLEIIQIHEIGPTLSPAGPHSSTTHLTKEVVLRSNFKFPKTTFTRHRKHLFAKQKVRTFFFLIMRFKINIFRKNKLLVHVCFHLLL